ncbi:MAG: ATP-binding protein [Candidatus Pacebacteria bacterium]|nr:ATP-binding protein [Candidatus Paceibacterota bacterium]
MIDTSNIVLFLVSLVNLALSGVSIFRSSSEKSGKAYSLFALFVSLWTFGLAMFRYSSFDSGLYWAIFYYISAALTVNSFLYFSLYFLDKGKIKSNYWTHLLMNIPITVIIILLLFNINFVKNYELKSWGKEIKLGSSYFFYILYILIYSCASFLILNKRYMSSEGLEKMQFKFVLVGTMVAFTFGIIFNLILPIYTYKLIWIGPFFSLFMVVMIAYAIMKHHLMDIKTIMSELFIGILMVVLFINIFFYENMLDLWFRIGIFLSTSLFGYFLIRSVFKEVRAREEIEELVEKLEFVNLRLRQLDEAKSDFISIASHQLRTPLTAIKGYASMILEGSYGKIPEKTRLVVDKIYQSAQRLVVIIGDFLDISHIEQGTMSYDFSSMDVKELVASLMGDFKATIENSPDKVNKIKLEFFADEKESCYINADHNKIRQIISNLIDNSIKYTPAGFVKVFLSRIPESGAVLLKVEDSGIGMSGETMANLFRKFGRAKGLSSLYANGSGLGLYVAKEIIKAHKGKIWAESDGEGKGSRFFVELPGR